MTPDPSSVSSLPGDDAPLADHASLQLLHDDAGGVADYVTLFRTEVARQTVAIMTAIQEKNGTALHAAAHRLKGSARLLGALRLTQRLIALEEAGLANDMDRGGLLVADLSTVGAASVEAVTKLASHLGE